MKRILVVLFPVACILLSGCTEKTYPVADMPTSEIDLKEKELPGPKSVIQKKKDELGSSYEVNEVSFTGSDVPQLLTFSYDSQVCRVEVLSYDAGEEKWNALYLWENHEHNNGTEKIALLKKTRTPEKKEQAVIGYNAGSGGFLHFLVLKEGTNGTLEVYEGMDEDYPNGTIEAGSDGWLIKSNGKIVETIAY